MSRTFAVERRAVSRRYEGRAERLGWSSERDAAVVNLYMRGLSNPEISAQTGISRHSVSGIVERLRLHRIIPLKRPARAA
jgi:hypothetical protein